MEPGGTGNEGNSVDGEASENPSGAAKAEGERGTTTKSPLGKLEKELETAASDDSDSDDKPLKRKPAPEGSPADEPARSAPIQAIESTDPKGAPPKTLASKVAAVLVMKQKIRDGGAGVGGVAETKEIDVETETKKKKLVSLFLLI